jgi:hypothetical protein
MSKPRRKASVHPPTGAGSIIPELPEPAPRAYACKRCVEYQAQVSRLRKVVRDQEEEIRKKQGYIEQYRATITASIARLDKPLLPFTTTRPARKGAGLE